MKYQEIMKRCNPSQTHQELNDLLLELEKMEIHNVLEIGVHLGGSLRIWQELFQPDILIGIDGKITPEFASIHGVYAIEGYSQTPQVLNQVETILNGRKLDFLFIDGSHYYNDVKDDYYTYKQFVRSGGIIAFHDVILTGNDTCEVHRFWQELLESGTVNAKTISYKAELGPSATGCGIVYV